MPLDLSGAFFCKPSAQKETTMFEQLPALDKRFEELNLAMADPALLANQEEFRSWQA